jgi:hypothetical protein
MYNEEQFDVTMFFDTMNDQFKDTIVNKINHYLHIAQKYTAPASLAHAHTHTYTLVISRTLVARVRSAERRMTATRRRRREKRSTARRTLKRRPRRWPRETPSPRAPRSTTPRS